MHDDARLLQEKYGGIETPEYAHDVARLKAGEPLAYVIGHIPFLGTNLLLTSRPLIPRPETEWWTEDALRYLRARPEREFHCLDLCAGSGAIGVALLTNEPRTHVTFSEREVRHLDTIQENIERNGIPRSRAVVVAGDLFQNTQGTFDLIVTNPPYLPESRKSTLDRSLGFEPHEALFAEENGLAIIKRIVEEVPSFLKQDGRLYLEFDAGQETLIASYFEKSPLHPVFHRDQFGLMRFLVAEYRHHV